MRPFLLIQLLLLLLTTSPLVHATAPSASELHALFPQLPEDVVKELIQNNTSHRYYHKGEAPLFEPNLPAAASEHLPQKNIDPAPNLSVEAIYFLPKKNTSLDNHSITEQKGLLALYNILRSISTLTGVEYYSESRGKMRTLFKSAYCVDNITNKNPIADPLAAKIPATSELTVFQEDLTFGKNFSKAVYRYSEGILSLSITNLNDMRYGFLPFIRKGNMQTQLVVIPQTSGFFIYGNVSVKTLSLLGFEKKKEASFYNRLHTLFIWLKNRCSQ